MVSYFIISHPILWMSIWSLCKISLKFPWYYKEKVMATNTTEVCSSNISQVWMTILLSVFLCPPLHSSEVSLHCFSDTWWVSHFSEIKHGGWLLDEIAWNSDNKQTKETSKKKNSSRKKIELLKKYILVQKHRFYSYHKVSDLQRANFL